ncbi:MAG: hypothetical protein QOD70_660 [Frankiales bacterium]|nr:hypothetical protein [Frankiales bacterium]
MTETVRVLDTPSARELAELASAFEELQTVLRCCERLISELAAEEQDLLSLEAFWSTALLSYTRCFATLTIRDVTATGLKGDVLGWHQVLLKLRDQCADPVHNPRESFTVGAAQDDQGKAAGIAVSSARQQPVDEVVVRQTGAIAFELSRLVDARIVAQQQAVFGALGRMKPDELEGLPLLTVAT